MSLLPEINQASSEINKLVAQANIHQTTAPVNPAEFTDPADTMLLASRDPVIREVSVGMTGDGYSDYTVSGTPPLSLPNSLGKPLKAWSVDLLPYQDLHGYDAPWPAGGGKNKCNGVAYNAAIGSNIAYIINMTPITSPFVITTNYAGAGFIAPVKSGETYAMSSDVLGSSSYFYWAIYASLDDITDRTNALDSGWSMVSFTATHDGYVVFMRENHPTGQTVTWTYAQLELGSTATTFTPYSNLCPIYGTDKLNMFVDESYDQSATPKAVITLPQTVYTGTVGSEGGEATWGNIASYNGETLPGEWISSMDVYAAGTTPTIGAQVVYELATPTTFAAPSVTIPTPRGTVTAWATAEDGTVDGMEVTYLEQL